MMKITRRTFVLYVLAAVASLIGLKFLIDQLKLTSQSPLFSKKDLKAPKRKEALPLSYKEAMFYQSLGGEKVRCGLCPQNCLLEAGERGLCRVRENRLGKLYTLVYNRPCSVNISPVEKAPFYHFIPGHQRLCIATVGCNLTCKFCNNWHISQASPGISREQNLSPEQIVEKAKRLKLKSISFTYTEPTIFYEYMYDVSYLARKEGIKTSIVSNGYINPEPLKQLIEFLDAVKIDLKAFNRQFYREICGGDLEPVLETLKLLKNEGAYFEIVNLIIPTLNDSFSDINRMCVWIMKNLGPDVPVHFIRFFPHYKITNLPKTPVEVLESAIGIGKNAGLRYVYIGNVPDHQSNSTFCRNCGRRVVHRIHHSIQSNHTEEGKCRFCKFPLPGIWK